MFQNYPTYVQCDDNITGNKKKKDSKLAIWWIIFLKQVSSLRKMMPVADWNEWKSMAALTVGNQSEDLGMLWKMAWNDVKYMQFVMNELKQVYNHWYGPLQFCLI